MVGLFWYWVIDIMEYDYGPLKTKLDVLKSNNLHETHTFLCIKISVGNNGYC